MMLMLLLMLMMTALMLLMLMTVGWQTANDFQIAMQSHHPCCHNGTPQHMLMLMLRTRKVVVMMVLHHRHHAPPPPSSSCGVDRFAPASNASAGRCRNAGHDDDDDYCAATMTMTIALRDDDLRNLLQCVLCGPLPQRVRPPKSAHAQGADLITKLPANSLKAICPCCGMPNFPSNLQAFKLVSDASGLARFQGFFASAIDAIAQGFKNATSPPSKHPIQNHRHRHGCAPTCSALRTSQTKM